MNVNVDPRPISEINPQLAAVHLHDAPGDRQAKAGAALGLGGRIVGLLEFLEDFSLIRP